ncbi:MAG: LLM class flavin-dependent oxidoreductase [Geodermatophilaceae bacterium]|nr:LLM class flavin-dependent oxidoreductase [Geodermatophilaceae bacterium]
MRIGAILPAGDRPDRPANWATVRDFALSADQGGLDSVWVFDHLLHESASGRTGQLEGWTTLSAVAAVTERVQVGTLVMCSPFRNPVLLAKMAATADEVSGGRLILGLGAGWHAPEFAAMGLSMEQRVDRFAEALPIVTGLLRGERITFAGKHHDVRAAELLPTPTRCIPVLVAALRPRMLRLTARYADAWNIAWYGAPDDHLRRTMAALREALDAEGRDPATLTITVGVHVHDPDSGEAPDPADTVLGGSLDELARALEDYAALGVDHLIVLPQPHTERTLARLIAARQLTE